MWSSVHELLLLLRPSICWLRRRRCPPSSGPRRRSHRLEIVRSSCTRSTTSATPRYTTLAAIHLVPHPASLHPHHLRLPIPRLADCAAVAQFGTPSTADAVLKPTLGTKRSLLYWLGGAEAVKHLLTTAGGDEPSTTAGAETFTARAVPKPTSG